MNRLLGSAIIVGVALAPADLQSTARTVPLA